MRWINGPFIVCVAIVLVTQVCPAAPVIFWKNDPVSPGDAVVVTGGHLGPDATVELARLDDSAVTEPPDASPAWGGKGNRVETVQASERSLKFVVPSDCQDGVFAFRIMTSGGTVSGLLNHPQVWWVQGDLGTQASPGGRVRLFGKCLASRPGMPKEKAGHAVVLLKGPKTVRIDATMLDDCAAEATLPADLPLGEYQVYAHNGFGGDVAWSAPVALTVAALEEWPQTVFSVKELGAAGTGDSDDTPAFQSALAAAEKNGGGIVYAPRGRYQIKGMLVLPPMTLLRGEKHELTCLCWEDTPAPPEALIKGTRAFGIEDLTIYAAHYTHVIVGNQPPKESGDVHVRRVWVRADIYRGQHTPAEIAERLEKALKLSTGGGDTIRLGGPNIEITDCDLYGSGRSLFLSRVRGGLVRGNSFYNGRWGWYCISGSDGLVFEDNSLTGADLMSTGGGINCLDGSPYSQNVYFARNKFRLLHGWDREAITSDAGGEVYAGPMTKVEGTTLILPKAPKWEDRDWHGAAVFILDGKGAGQFRRVASWKGAKVVVDRPWNIEPDAKSFVSVTMLQNHYLLINNEFTDTGGLQFYGTSIECIVAGNRGARMQGFRGLGLWYNGYQPSWYCQFLGNEVLEGNYYHWSTATDAILEISGDAPGQVFPGPLNIGTVVRGNRLLNNAHIRVAVCRDAVIEKNNIADSDLGILVTKRNVDILLRENTFTNVKQETRDERAQQ